MVPAEAHDFFVATASAAAALIGLLFVALSVWQGRELKGPLAESHRLRATGALTVFTNALAISLYGLLPHNGLGEPAAIFAGLGLAFIAASSLRLVRVHRRHRVTRIRDLLFLILGLALFGSELYDAIGLWNHPHDASDLKGLQQLVIFCFLFGIARSWELIGGPQIGVIHEMSAMLRSSDGDLAPSSTEPDDDSGGDPSAPATAEGES